MVRDCTKLYELDSGTSFSGYSHWSIFICSTSLYCRDITNQYPGNFGFNVSVDGNIRSACFLFIRPVFADEADVTCWRPMFYAGILPALILLIGMFCMPESPRWLMSKGRKQEAMLILNKIEGHGAAEEVAHSINAEIEKVRMKFRNGVSL